MLTTPPTHYPDYPERGLTHGGLPLRELLGILRRRRRAVAWVVVLLTTLATLVGLQVTPMYTATALVMIEPRESRIVDLTQVVPNPAADTASIETQMQVLGSRETLREAVDRLDLLATVKAVPEPSIMDGWLKHLMELLTNVTDLLSEGWMIAVGIANEPRDKAEPDPGVLRQRAENELRDGLTVMQLGRSYVLAVSYTATNPDEAARVANGLTQAYVEGQRERKLATTKRASSWLAERVEELREQVIRSEAAIHEHRVRLGLVDAVQGVTLDGQQLAALMAELIRVRAERTTNEATLRKLQELRDGGQNHESLAKVMNSPFIMTLRQRELELVREQAQLSRAYGERHPRMVQLQAERDQLAKSTDLELENAINSLTSDIAVARSREDALQQTLDQAKGDSALSRHASLKVRELEREAAPYHSLYENFIIRLKETEEQQQIVQPDARVISPAVVPTTPSSPSPMLFTAVGFTASLVLGVVVALLREQLDYSLRSGRQVAELLEVRSIGLVPKVTRLKRTERLHKYLAGHPRSAYAEGVRALYTQIRIADADRPPQVILVTSALPGEGKTSLATSLAVFAAQVEQRTLLIDLDLRRPSVYREFGLRPDTGIIEVAGGCTLLEDAVHRDKLTGLDVLPVGQSHSNPTALLTSQGLATALRRARESYDLVIIDTPPVLGVTDAKALVAQVDAVAFVIQWEKTKQQAAQAALKELRDAAADIVGAVLNQADMKRHARYAYGDVGQYYTACRTYYVN